VPGRPSRYRERSDGERVVDGDAVAGLELVGEPRGDIREDLLVVAVLFEDDLVVGDLLDGGEIERGGLQRLVLPLELVDLLPELGLAVLGGVELTRQLLVDARDLGEVVLQRGQPLVGPHIRVQVERGLVW
jgi:hypothetical protein